MLSQLITSFVATGAFGVIFNVPRSSLVKCGFIGMIGWAVYVMLVDGGVAAVPATLAASFSVTIIGHVFARLYKTPMIVFSVSGIIPLVPGGMAYDAMRNFVENDYNEALQVAAKAFTISGAIAIGLVFSEVINQVVKKVRL